MRARALAGTDSAAQVNPINPSRRRHDRSAALLAITCLSITLLPAFALHSYSKPKKVYKALIAGTVFNIDGVLMRGADVTVRAVNGGRTWQARTDESGEFFVYLPAGRADYLVEARAAGYLPDKAVVRVIASERETIFLHLKRSR